MKKWLLCIGIVIAVSTIFLTTGAAWAAPVKDVNIPTGAKGAYLVDFDTGTVLYERDADHRLPIASMVKIMTLVITFDEIKAGNLKFDDQITVSETAAGMGGSQMFLDANQNYSVSDLIKGVTVVSANDASVALAETISGSVEAFIDRMNETARKLGMNDTVFVNVTGLPAEGQYSTARDVTTMMRVLLQNPEYYRFSGIYMEDYRHPDGRITELVNTNKLIRFYKGCDAGKTGFTNDAMFCLSASAKRGGMRVIATVVGAENSKARFAEVSALFNYGFANYASVAVVEGGKPVGREVGVKGGRTETVTLAADRDIRMLLKKGQKPDCEIITELSSELKAPIRKGETVGTLTVKTKAGELVGKANIVAMQDIDPMRFEDALGKVLQNWFL